MIDIFAGLLAALTFKTPAHAATLPALNSFPVSAEAQRPSAPVKKNVASLGIETTSKAVFVADVPTGTVLFSKRPHDVYPIASLTKLMTAMVFLDTHPNLDGPITFIESDFDTESKGVFSVGETITAREALQALLIGSVNAAGSAIARSSLGTDVFVTRMNEKARSLHLDSPEFVEPTGLDPRNTSDAADVAAMLTTALSYPDIKSITEMSAVTIKGSTGKEHAIKSTNLLLDTFLNKAPYHIVGAKTGSLPEAGFCMAQVTRDGNGHQIVVVNLGSTNHFARYQEVKALTSWAFETYAW